MKLNHIALVIALATLGLAPIAVAGDGLLATGPGGLSEGQPRPIRSGHDVFGPDIGMDAYGRPTVVVPAFDGPGSVLGPVIPDVFGPGIGMDAAGRPVIVVPKN